jgi:hypothetical protein
MKMTRALGVVLALTAALLAQTAPKSVTVPVTLDHNRTIVDVRLPLPDGKTTRVRAWVDTGNPELWITADLAKKLGLVLAGDPRPTLYGKERASTVPAEMQVGGMSISLAGVKEAHAILDRESIAPGCSAEINLPSTILRSYDVIFDYPERQFTIGTPGSVAFKGSPVKSMITEASLIQVPAKIAGQNYSAVLDTGASISLISSDLVARWHKAQPTWPWMKGAVAAANMWGLDEEPQWELLRLPALALGPSPLANVAVVGFPEEELKQFQLRAGTSSIGLLGANALRGLRVGIDYAHGTVYLEAAGGAPGADMNVVGLTLRPEPDERYTVLGVIEIDGKSAVPGVKPGDVLLGVDGAPVTGATMGQVWSLLGGAPGQVRKLVVERAGQRMTVEAAVREFLTAPAINK